MKPVVSICRSKRANRDVALTRDKIFKLILPGLSAQMRFNSDHVQHVSKDIDIKSLNSLHFAGHH